MPRAASKASGSRSPPLPLQLATNDNWTDVFRGLLVRPPECDPAADECGTWVAIPFTISFVVLVSMVMLNLFTAVIIENFEKQQEQEAWRLNPQSLEEFVTLWSEYDDGSGSIDPRDLEALLLWCAGKRARAWAERGGVLCVRGGAARGGALMLRGAWLACLGPHARTPPAASTAPQAAPAAGAGPGRGGQGRAALRV